VNQQLLDNNYIHVPGFIAPERAAHLAAKFEREAEEHQLGGDSQIPLSQATHNYLPFVRLLVEKVPHVIELAGEEVLPTYTYARIHRTPGAELHRHRDRPACEVSLTLNLAKSEPWPICIQKPNGEEVCLEQNPGDAMLYLVCIADHWRAPYTGNHHVQVFMHYVRSYGDNAWAFFDRQQ
jgi:hypothetical protein